jgi:hypothetical protein
MSLKHKRTAASNLSDSEDEPTTDLPLKRKRSYGEFASISGVLSDNLSERSDKFRTDDTNHIDLKKFKTSDGSKSSYGAKLMVLFKQELQI